MLTFLTNSLSHLNTCLFLFAGVLILVRRWMLRRVDKKGLPLPPGPKSYPFFGRVFQMKNQSHLQVTKLGEVFGPIFQFSMGKHTVVVLNDHKLIREAFRQTVFSGRPDTSLTKLLKGFGIINSAGALWQEQRLFLHNVLRDFGAKNIGPNRVPLEKNIKTQVFKFLSDIRATQSSPYHIRPRLARAVSNVVGGLLMDVTFDNNDAAFNRLNRLIEEGFKLLTMSNPVNFIDSFQYIPWLNKNFRKIEQNLKETGAFFKEIIQAHKDTYQEGKIRDFVDAFYCQQQKVESQNKQTYFTDEQLLQVIGDVYSAGLETVTSTIEWAVLFMVRQPDVQKRLQEEIDQVVGHDREPKLEDMPLMPYTEATILEVMRRANVVPLGNTHSAVENAELGGYFIAKDTHIVPNLWAVHMNPDLWDSPHLFKPERFLVNNRIVKPSYFMPFSVGRRMCVGDTLARMEVFLFLTCLLQEFRLCLPEGSEPPSLEGQAALSLNAKPFSICAVPRKSA